MVFWLALRADFLTCGVRLTVVGILVNALGARSGRLFVTRRVHLGRVLLVVCEEEICEASWRKKREKSWGKPLRV